MRRTNDGQTQIGTERPRLAKHQVLTVETMATAVTMVVTAVLATVTKAVVETGKIVGR